MSEEIFRKKSLEKIKSPETLDEYIKVSSPSVWLLLISVIILLIGACVWGVFGHIDSTVPAAVQVKNESAICYIDEKDISSVQQGLTVKFSDIEAKIDSIGEKTEQGYSCSLSMDESISDGVYEGKIVVKRHKPLSFILN